MAVDDTIERRRLMLRSLRRVHDAPPHDAVAILPLGGGVQIRDLGSRIFQGLHDDPMSLALRSVDAL